MKRLIPILFLLTACATATAPPPPDPADLDIRATVIAEYNVISGPAGRRDWDRFQELFAAGAHIDALTPEEYVAKNKPYFNEHSLFQRPTTMRVERHGETAHVTVQDESRHASNDAEPYARGTTAFDLVHGGDAWKIASIVTK